MQYTLILPLPMEKLLINKAVTAENSTRIVHVRLEGETNNYDSKTRDSTFESLIFNKNTRNK